MLADTFAWSNTPLGATVVGGILVIVLVGTAVRLSKGVHKTLTAVLRWLFSIRITTSRGLSRRTSTLIQDRQKLVVNARWIIAVPKHGKPDELIVENVAQGSVAHAVKVESDSYGFTFLSAADWLVLQPGAAASFFGHWDQFAYSAPQFTVTWTDLAGTRRAQFVRILGS